MTQRSLRARLIIGTALWAVGILTLTGIVATVAVHLQPRRALLVHNSILIIAAVTVVTAGATVIRRGLSPLTMLRDRLASIRDGRTTRLEGDYPAEVAPLVDDLNRLLEERERRVERAVARAGDLAHGLKTPLAILSQDIERADALGQHALAASMREQLERMRRQIESHLAQARATASGPGPGSRARVDAATEGLARTMTRLYAERHLAIVVAPSAVVVGVPLEDLEEMLGNLLDNACKWARSRVSITARATGTMVAILVDDDGPGLDASMRDAVMQRGVRADETAPGSGLGLAIVRDLANVYGGAVTLDASPEGGVRAHLTLPLA